MLLDQPSHYLLDLSAINGAIPMKTEVLLRVFIQYGEHPQLATTHGECRE